MELPLQSDCRPLSFDSGLSASRSAYRVRRNCVLKGAMLLQILKSASLARASDSTVSDGSPPSLARSARASADSLRQACSPARILGWQGGKSAGLPAVAHANIRKRERRLVAGGGFEPPTFGL